MNSIYDLLGFFSLCFLFIFLFNFFILINLILFPDYLEYVLSVRALKHKCLLGDAFLVLLKHPFPLPLMASLHVAQAGLGVLDDF